MRIKIYLRLLILCCIFSQGINVLSEENNDESANLHVRKKRVIDETPDGNLAVPIEKVPYIVSIHRNNSPMCAGSILSPNIIITAAHCIVHTEENHVLSGSSFDNLGSRHIITKLLLFPKYNPHVKTRYDLALLTIYPYIDFSLSTNRPIKLLNTELPLDSVGTVSGWGSNKRAPNHHYPWTLRSINLPLFSRDLCQQYYNYASLIIDEKVFCTLDVSRKKACGPGDSGNPFVFNGYLAGILSGSDKSKLGSPEVFANLCDHEYNEWIRKKIAKNPPNEHARHIPFNFNVKHPNIQHRSDYPHNHHTTIN